MPSGVRAAQRGRWWRRPQRWSSPLQPPATRRARPAATTEATTENPRSTGYSILSWTYGNGWIDPARPQVVVEAQLEDVGVGTVVERPDRVVAPGRGIGRLRATSRKSRRTRTPATA